MRALDEIFAEHQRRTDAICDRAKADFRRDLKVAFPTWPFWVCIGLITIGAVLQWAAG